MNFLCCFHLSSCHCHFPFFAVCVRLQTWSNSSSVSSFSTWLVFVNFWSCCLTVLGLVVVVQVGFLCAETSSTFLGRKSSVWPCFCYFFLSFLLSNCSLTITHVACYSGSCCCQLLSLLFRLVLACHSYCCECLPFPLFLSIISVVVVAE